MSREEAIEVYNGLINTKIKEAFEFFAPELREINEEEIRKDIIGGLMWQRDNLKSEGPHDNNLILPGFCLTVGKHLSYLEKQKESLHISETCKENADSFTDEDERIRRMIENTLRDAVLSERISETSYREMSAYLEKQKEQKPAEYKPKAGEDIYHAINGAINLAIDIQRSVSLCFNGVTLNVFPESCISEIVSYYHEQVKDDVQRGAPAEWSEEDEKMMRFYENDYDNNLGNMPMCDVIENRIKFKGWLVNKLESLRPSWKPSEEQISSLKQARDYYMSGRIKYVGRHLSEIAEQLEKLM